MSKQAGHTIAVHALMNDPYDGIARMLGDAQRLGYAIRGMVVDADRHPAATKIALTVPCGTDLGHLAARMGRFSAVVSASVTAADAATSFRPE